MRRYRAQHLYTTSGWMSPGYLGIDSHGSIATVVAEQPRDWPGKPVIDLNGFTVPGSINVHSHAHLRGLAGRTEHASANSGSNNLWTWRDQMYTYVERIAPQDLQALAAQAYVEMVEAGFTSVAEFHYLHHDPLGRSYANPSELAERVLAGAEEAGIGITLLPVLYATGGVGEPPLLSQRRFLHEDPDAYLSLVERIADGSRDAPLVRVGIAPHSLRAVDEARLKYVVQSEFAGQPDVPVHIHVAERQEEVDECIAHLGARPIDWLVSNIGIDPRWTLVHATHCSERERKDVATSQAIVGLCPATEANLGDGIFPLPEYVADGGSWAVGTDMNHAISLVDEVRVLELGQRLRHERRNILTDPADEATAHAGRRLLDLMWAAGGRSVNQPVGAIHEGSRADLVVLDPEHPSLCGHGPETVLDAWVLSSVSNPARDVMVGGRWVVEDGQHEHRERVLRQFRAAIERLWSAGGSSAQEV